MACRSLLLAACTVTILGMCDYFFTLQAAASQPSNNLCIVTRCLCPSGDNPGPRHNKHSNHKLPQQPHMRTPVANATVVHNTSSECALMFASAQRGPPHHHHYHHITWVQPGSSATPQTSSLLRTTSAASWHQNQQGPHHCPAAAAAAP